MLTPYHSNDEKQGRGLQGSLPVPFKTIRAIPETCMLGMALVLSLAACATPEKASTPTTQHITFKKDIHFLSEQAGDLLVDAGHYTVKPPLNQTESLQLVGPHSQGDMPLVIDAIEATHQETLEQPKVVSIGGDELHYLALLLPEGIGYEVMGSYSGVWPRGGVGEMANRQVFQTALIKERQSLDKLKEHILDLVKQGRLVSTVSATYLKDLQPYQATVSKNLTALRTTDVLALQSAMQEASRIAQILSNAMKARHDIDNSLIHNIR